MQFLLPLVSPSAVVLVLHSPQETLESNLQTPALVFWGKPHHCFHKYLHIKRFTWGGQVDVSDMCRGSTASVRCSISVNTHVHTPLILWECFMLSTCFGNSQLRSDFTNALIQIHCVHKDAKTQRAQPHVWSVFTEKLITD